MTRIDFYLIPDLDLAARARFACRLCHRAYGLGNQVYVHTDSVDAARSFDELLWSYPTEGFIPHGLMGEAMAEKAPIVIGHGEDCATEADDVLVNLTNDIVPFFGRFERLAEIVIQNEDLRAQGRRNYKYYRDRGYPLFHHEIEDWRD
jgi:DNA polymerase-3 subunit chi